MEGLQVIDWSAEVTEKYELEVTNMRKGRGSWIFETDRGLKLLKEYKGSAKRLEFEDVVLVSVREGGALRVDRYVRNREGELITTAEDGTRYLVKDWFYDRECDLKDTREILSAVRQIAVLHRCLRDVEPREEWNLRSMIAPPLHEVMERHNRELKKARNYIKGKHKKNAFELEVIASYDAFYAQAVEACEGMKRLFQRDAWMPQAVPQLAPKQISQSTPEPMPQAAPQPAPKRMSQSVPQTTPEPIPQAVPHPAPNQMPSSMPQPTSPTPPAPTDKADIPPGYRICHGDLNHHHILMGRDYVAVTEFNKMHLGLQVEDIYDFMRKVMEKHNWNAGLGASMLDAYERILPLDPLERRCLYYLFLYPEKYWKQISFYYNTNKAWIPERSTEKLAALGRQQENRMEFIEYLGS